MLDQAARLEFCYFPYSSNPVPNFGSAHFGFLNAPGTLVHDSLSDTC